MDIPSPSNSGSHSPLDLVPDNPKKNKNEPKAEADPVAEASLDVKQEQPPHNRLDSSPPSPPRTPFNLPPAGKLLSPASGTGIVIAQEPEDPFVVAPAAAAAEQASASVASSSENTSHSEFDLFTSTQRSLVNHHPRPVYSLPTPPQRQPPRLRLRRRQRPRRQDQQVPASHHCCTDNIVANTHQQVEDGSPTSSFAN